MNRSIINMLLAWLYLNKGTHEEFDCEDYDPNLVRTIVENLETLTQLPLRPVPRVLK